MDDQTPHKRTPGSGRKPSGRGGEVRNAVVSFKLSNTEQGDLQSLLDAHGLPRTGVGVRDLLFQLAAEMEHRAPPIAA